MVTNLAVSLQCILLWAIVIFLTTIMFSSACSNGDPRSENSEFTYEEQNIHLCDITDGDSVHQTENCYSDIKKCDSSVVEYDIDKIQGKLTVTYKLEKLTSPNCNRSEWKQLDIDLYDCPEVKQPTTIKGVFNKDECELHSSKFFNITVNSKGNEQCSKNITVTFHYVYSSSYVISITSCGRSSCCVFSCPFPVITNYTKEVLYKPEYNINFSSNCMKNTEDNGRYVLHFNVIENLLNKPRATFMVQNSKNKSSFIYSCKRESTNSEWHCNEPNSNESFNCHHSLDVKEKNRNTSTFICHNVPEGVYNFFVSYNDLRCRIGTLWNKYTGTGQLSYFCQWDQSLIANTSCKNPITPTAPVTTYRPVVTTSEIIAYVILSICITVCLIAIVLIWWLYNRGKEDPQEIPEPPLPDPRMIKIGLWRKIFLLYARDSKEFHKAMDEFREVLTHYNCVVFDIWDEKQAKDIAGGFEKWVTETIDVSDFLILVESDCARELRDRDTRGIIDDHYINPNCFDRLFTFAVNSLVERRCRSNLFVVRIADLQEQKYTSRDEIHWKFMPNSYARYSLPAQFILLLCELKCIRFTGTTQVVPDDMELPDDIKQFQEAALKYIDFESKNPNYTDKILKCRQSSEEGQRHGHAD